MIEKLLASCLKPVLEAEVQLQKRKVITFTLLAGLAGMLALLAAAYLADSLRKPPTNLLSSSPKRTVS